MRSLMGIAVAISLVAGATSAVASASYPPPAAERVEGQERLFGNRSSLLLPIILLAVAVGAYLILRDRGDETPVTP